MDWPPKLSVPLAPLPNIVQFDDHLSGTLVIVGWNVTRGRGDAFRGILSVAFCFASRCVGVLFPAAHWRVQRRALTGSALFVEQSRALADVQQAAQHQGKEGHVARKLLSTKMSVICNIYGFGRLW